MRKPMRSTPDVILQVSSLAEATDFYEKVLGLPVTSPRQGLAKVETGSIVLYLEEGRLPGPVFDFLVDDVQATKNALLKRGCTLIEENPAVPRCYLRDPFGLVFNVDHR
jgi:catechol 2,3-dioxygenase-like lactoylglutathione lyase family enzyme